MSKGVTYHFVVRAFDGDLESVDSEEVSYTPAAVVLNQAPMAVAGQNQSVDEGTSVTLDGSGSSDTDGTIVGYQWVQTGGTGISINNSTSAQASFTAPVVGIDGDTLTFSLTVADDDGKQLSFNHDGERAQVVQYRLSTEIMYLMFWTGFPTTPMNGLTTIATERETIKTRTMITMG